MTVHGPAGSLQLEGLADTAATFTKIPDNLARGIGLQAQFRASIELGDGRTVTRPLALAEVEIGGVRRPVLVALGGDSETPLIGYTTLEVLGLKVNVVTDTLEETRAIEYAEASMDPQA